VPGEDWHAELIGSEGHYTGAQQMGSVGMDVNWITAQESPEERQDRLIGTYFDAITGAMSEDTAQGAQMFSSPDITQTEIASPSEAGSPLSSPDLAAGGGTGTQPAPDIRVETLTMPGQQPGMPMQAGGQFQGNVPPPGYVPPGKGVGRWRGVMEAALRYAGVTPTPELVALGLRRMAQESGGDNFITQKVVDVNSRRGDPAKGLMQNIGSAFPDRARELTNRGIFDGFANIVASIRYTLGRYGSLERGWGRPGGY
jgi:hypothetical protein